MPDQQTDRKGLLDAILADMPCAFVAFLFGVWQHSVMAGVFMFCFVALLTDSEGR